MRALVLPALLLLALPALPAGSAPVQAPLENAVELSHGFFVPYMHAAALNVAPGIRPGGWVQINGSDCTLAFVLRNTAGELFITTAGHCTGPLGQRASVTQDAPIASLAPPMQFGTLVASWPRGLDAALIKIDADKYDLVNPSMVGWGGPTGLVTDNPDFGSVTLHHGWGWATWYDQQTRCRRGLLDSTNRDIWVTLEHGGGGDSGSAIMMGDGRALGILDWGGGVVVPTFVTGAFVSTHVAGVRMDAVLNAWNAQGWGLELVTGGPVNPVCVPEPSLPVG